MIKTRITALLVFLIGASLGYFLYNTQETKPFSLGLDLSGGSYLVYSTDVSQIDPAEVGDAVESLRDVIERRVNLFGVSEPNVQTETSSLTGGEKEHRLVVELPGVTDLEEAVSMIGQTPLLEFKLRDADAEAPTIELSPDEDGNVEVPELNFNDLFVDTGLTGRYLSSASLQFTQGVAHGGGSIAGEPVVAITFDKEGRELFGDITTENTGEVLAIFLDGAPISTPVIQTSITNGEAIITGDFTPDEAKELVGRLNSGALPIPIELLSTQTIGASLGQDATDAGVMAGIIGFILVGIFLILWYRLPGVLAVVALGMYAAAMLFVFKTLPVTLTAAGIAGFIISLGIAVDANILIFERVKEELKDGQTVFDSIKVGFNRAWASIRDANISSLISAVILFWFGTSLIKGFALTFGLGVLISMISAISVTKIFLFAVAGRTTTRLKRFLFTAGFNK